MRIAEDEIFCSFALVVRVTDRTDLVLVVIAHASLRLIISQPDSFPARAYFNAGAALDRLNHCREVRLGADLVAGELQHAGDRLCHFHGHTERAGFLQAQLDVLRHQPGGEAEIEQTWQDDAAELVFRGGIAPTAGLYHVEHHAGIEARLHAQHHGFGCCGHRGRRQKVVAELHRLACSGAFADEEDLAEHRKCGLDVGDLRTRPGYHDRERAFGRAGNPAAHRAVDLYDAARLEQIENSLGHHRAGGRKIDEAAHALSLDYAGFASSHGEHHIRRRQARHDRLDLVGDGARAVALTRSNGGETIDRLAPAVADQNVMSRFEQTTRHMEPHLTHSDETDIHARSFSCLNLVLTSAQTTDRTHSTVLSGEAPLCINIAGTHS